MEHLKTCNCIECLNSFSGEYAHEPQCDCARCEDEAFEKHLDIIDAQNNGN